MLHTQSLESCPVLERREEEKLKKKKIKKKKRGRVLYSSVCVWKMIW
jgi:hypothetical protein